MLPGICFCTITGDAAAACDPNIAVDGADLNVENPFAEGTIDDIVGFPRFAVENADAVIECSDPKASLLVEGKGVAVGIAGFIFVLFPLFIGFGVAVVVIDAVIFGADPGTIAAAVRNEGDDELCLDIKSSYQLGPLDVLRRRNNTDEEENKDELS